MCDAGFEAVGPVVEEDDVVSWIGEGDGRVVGEGWRGAGEGFPVQAFLDYIGCDAAIGAFDVVGPGEIAAEVGGEAFELFEGVCFCGVRWVRLLYKVWMLGIRTDDMFEIFPGGSMVVFVFCCEDLAVYGGQRERRIIEVDVIC